MSLALPPWHGTHLALPFATLPRAAQVWINITALLGEMEFVVGFTADAFQPLLTADDTRVQIIDTGELRASQLVNRQVCACTRGARPLARLLRIP